MQKSENTFSVLVLLLFAEGFCVETVLAADFSVVRLSFSVYCKNAMRKVSLSLRPSFSHSYPATLCAFSFIRDSTINYKGTVLCLPSSYSHPY